MLDLQINYHVKIIIKKKHVTKYLKILTVIVSEFLSFLNDYDNFFLGPFVSAPELKLLKSWEYIIILFGHVKTGKQNLIVSYSSSGDFCLYFFSKTQQPSLCVCVCFFP